VRKGERFEETRVSGKYSYSDQNFYFALDNRCGIQGTFGTIKFFCVSTTGDLGRVGKPNPKSGWKINARYGIGDCEVDPGPLPSTDRDPVWWGNAPRESAERRANLYWNCCCHDNRDFDVGDADPK
jgi:hypothetical protein